MTICEALTRAHALLQSCSINMKDAAAAGEALNLIAASVNTLSTLAEKDKEEIE